MQQRIRVANICLAILISIGFVLLGVFVFAESYFRTFEALTDLLGSFKYYFCVIFGLENVSHASVTEYSNVLNLETILPQNIEEFADNVSKYFAMLFSGENVKAYMWFVGDKSFDLVKILTIILPCILLLVLVLKVLYGQRNTKHNKDTKPLVVVKSISSKVFVPIRDFVRQYLEFVNGIGWLKIVWVIVWCLHLNLATIVIEFFAFYFYFAVSFDIPNIYVQFCKLVLDLQVIFKNVPVWVWVVIGLYLFNRWRKKIALNRLRHFEARNCGFINELPIVSMSCGSMGKKKTTLITDMALSQEVMFRQKALDILQKTDMKFPHFPWICFEDELKACMQFGMVHNLATIKQWVQLKRCRFEKHHNTTLQLYGYDIEKNGCTYNDSLKISSLWDSLEIYAQAYFVYVIESSLIVSNYSIRTDNRFMDEGNFPSWAMDFFPEEITEGRHAHIMDFDAFRLGKKMIENNPNIGSFEFGVVVISEVGKERGNNLELKEVKKGTDETNQKNDLFNAWLKMCRHSATIDNFPFIKVFTDEQRPESWGADARDLCDIVHIVSSSEQRLALPFYTIEDMVAEWAFNGFIDLYYKFRFRRGDNTLLVHCLKSFTAWLWKRNVRIYNKYGFCVLKIEKERGTMDGKPEKKRYFLMNKKIYSRRFSTDCFSDYFNDLAGKANVGIGDYLEYATEKATVEELKMQNSYFMNSLYK